MPILDHIHSYVKWRKQKSDNHQLWKCADPHCTANYRQDAIEGKASLCPQCFTKELILDPDALRRVRPLCIECRNTKEAKVYKASKEKLQELFNKDAERIKEFTSDNII